MVSRETTLRWASEPKQTGLGVAGEVLEGVGEGDVVPGDILLDFVLRYAGGVNLDLDGAGGVGHFGDKERKAL